MSGPCAAAPPTSSGGGRRRRGRCGSRTRRRSKARETPGPRGRRHAAHARYRAQSPPRSSSPSVSMASPGPHCAAQAATSSSKARAKKSSRQRSSVRPAAMAWPPNLPMSCGWRASRLASTSRMWIPGTERAEPRSCPSPASGERDHRPADPILDAARHQPDDALVPTLIEEADAAALQGARARIAQPAYGRERLRLHARLDRPPLVIELIEARRRARRQPASSSASRHWIPTVMSSRRPAALSRGATPKARSAAMRLSERPSGDVEQGADAGGTAAGADALQSLRDEHAVVGIERHEIGDRTQGHEIEELRGAGSTGRRQPLLIEPPLQRRHHVEGHTRRRRARGS